MKRLVLFLLALSVAFAGIAQNWEWAKGTHGNGSEGYYCSSDRWGNVYGLGHFFGPLYVEQDTIVHPNGSAFVLIKYNNAGNYCWARTNSYGAAIEMGFTTDPFGNIYVLGGYDSTTTIGTYTLTNSNLKPWQYFIAKYDSAGNVLWAKNLGNAKAHNPYGSITTSYTGEVYVTGTFSNNPTLGPNTLTNVDQTDSTDDIFVSRLDSSGNVIWAKSYGSNGSDIPMDLAVTLTHQVYICGNFTSDSLAFGTTVLYDTGSKHYDHAIYLCKLDSAGNALWANGAGGGSQYENAYGLVTDSLGEVYMTGWVYQDSLQFDTCYITPWEGGAYAYLVKYSPAGTLLWGRKVQGHVVKAWSLDIDPCNNVWMSGSMDNDIVDTIDGHIINPPPGSRDAMYIAGWDANGNYISSVALASGGDDYNGIAADGLGNINLFGDYEVDTFIVGNTWLLRGNATENIFTAKYNPGLNCSLAEKVSQQTPACDLKIYPNPATSTITIQYNKPIQNTTASIYDITGRLMGSYLLTGSNTTISVQNLPPGIYQCRIMDVQHNVVTKKIVVMR